MPAYIYENPDPYDQWERFKLPIWQKILVFLFFTKKDKKELRQRIYRINRMRRDDHRKQIERMRKNLRPRGQSGAVKPTPRYVYLLYKRDLKKVESSFSQPWVYSEDISIGKLISNNVISQDDTLVFHGETYTVKHIEHQEGKSCVFVKTL